MLDAQLDGAHGGRREVLGVPADDLAHPQHAAIGLEGGVARHEGVRCPLQLFVELVGREHLDRRARLGAAVEREVDTVVRVLHRELQPRVLVVERQREGTDCLAVATQKPVLDVIECVMVAADVVADAVEEAVHVEEPRRRAADRVRVQHRHVVGVDAEGNLLRAAEFVEVNRLQLGDRLGELLKVFVVLHLVIRNPVGRDELLDDDAEPHPQIVRHI
mmetsp:Transcript_5774/g.18172  ORF Transcript_5774/g.18172 Transcript_5774/m.18172 type:complete len:218 (+) Transcript_5774:156-809(+)